MNTASAHDHSQGSCCKPTSNSAPQTGNQSQAKGYTCPMHPEVVSQEPGRCPKCRMFLVAVK